LIGEVWIGLEQNVIDVIFMLFIILFNEWRKCL